MYLIHYFDRIDIFKLNEKVKAANWFYKHYDSFSAQDIYTWLWYGEFGYPELPTNDLSTLKKDIRLARLSPPKLNLIWEPIGLSKKFIKINLGIYYEIGYPLKRLLQLVSEVEELQKFDRLTFKNHWNLMKIQFDYSKKITLQDFYNFENKIPFHMTPYLGFTEEFLKEFSPYYRIVSLDSFFQYFPECIDLYPDIFIEEKNLEFKGNK